MHAALSVNVLALALSQLFCDISRLRSQSRQPIDFFENFNLKK